MAAVLDGSLNIAIVMLLGCKMRNIIFKVAEARGELVGGPVGESVGVGGPVGESVGAGATVGVSVSVGHLFPDRTVRSELGYRRLCSQIKLPSLIDICMTLMLGVPEKRLG